MKKLLPILIVAAVIGFVAVMVSGCQFARMTEEYKAPSQQTTPSHSAEATRSDPNLDTFLEKWSKSLDDWRAAKPVEPTGTPTFVQTPNYTYAKVWGPSIGYRPGWILVRIHDDPNGMRFVQPIKTLVVGETQ